VKCKEDELKKQLVSFVWFTINWSTVGGRKTSVIRRLIWN